MKNLITIIRNNQKHLISLTVLFVMSLIIYMPLFKSGLCCDDLGVLYASKIEEAKVLNWKFILKDPYAAQYLYVLVNYNLFGLVGFPYFFIGFLLSFFSTISIYFGLYKILNKWSFAFCVSSLSIIGYIGIESREAAVNAISFLGIGLMNIGLYFLYKHYKEYKTSVISKNLLFSYTLLFSAFIISPIRLQGLVLLYAAIEIIATIFYKTSIKASIIRIICVLVSSLLLLQKMGVFLSGAGTANKTTQQLSLLTSTFFTEGFKNSLVTLSRIILPPSSFWSSIDLKTESIIGGLILLFYLTALIVYKRKKHYKNFSIIFISLSWIFSFSIIAHIYYPNQVFDSTVRYLTVSSLGAYSLVAFAFLTIIPDLIGYIKTITKNNIYNFNYKFYLYGILIIYIAMHYYAVYKHLRISQDERYDKNIQNAFYSMNHDIQPIYGKTRPLIYIESDNQKFSYFAITYGGQQRFALQNNNLDPTKLPLFVTSQQDVINIMNKDSTTLKNYSLTNNEKFELFGYRLKDMQIVSITESIRKDVQK